RMQAALLTLPGAKLSNVQASLAPGADGRPQLQLRAAHVSLPALGWKDVALSVSGAPIRSGPHAWRLDGLLAIARAPDNALSAASVSVLIDTDAGSLDVKLAQRDTALRVLMPLDQPSHMQLTMKGLPLAWLRGVLAQAWAGGHTTSGTLDGGIALDLPARGATLSGKFAIANGGFDSRSGTLAGQQLGARGTFTLDTTAPDSRLTFDGSLSGGQLLLGSLYAQLPSHPSDLQIDAKIDARGIDIDALHFDDHGALSTDGKLGFDTQDNLISLALTHFDARLPWAYTRYGSAWLATLGWKDLTIAGRLTGSIRVTNGAPAQFALQANDVAIADGEGRIALTGLTGGLDWDARAPRPASTLAWTSLALNKLPFGAAQLHFKSDAGALALATSAQIPLLGGGFSLQKLMWRPNVDKQDRVEAAFAVADIDMSALCKLFGWPAFSGTLGGAVPGLHYKGDQIQLDGGLSVHVFDGFVDVTSLSLTQPFGIAPSLAADIDLRQLDLAQLTGVFDFGSITGRLDGKIAGLNLVDWKPVAFDAQLHADDGGRISQRALKSLTEVGGGGIAAGLQGVALSLFKTFGYSRIGLSCVLRAQVCTMGGIDSQTGGYTIMKGSGLPHISVIGHQREVDWPTLVDRLKVATEGNGPVIK
ncbi:MAG: YdbH domain-containing protein, partial [Pseudomonadota bacterium]|nr:YdbH domain-containing protein [Pseudomonadota bacterium]